MESTASTPSTAREFQDTASPAVVSLYSVVPALIATKDGGATPVKAARVNTGESENNSIYQTKIHQKGWANLTKKGTNEENSQRHIDDR